MRLRVIVSLIVLALEYGAVTLTLPDRFDPRLPLAALGLALLASALVSVYQWLTLKKATAEDTEPKRRPKREIATAITNKWGAYLAQIGFLAGIFLTDWRMIIAVLTPMVGLVVFYGLLVGFQQLRRRRQRPQES